MRPLPTALVFSSTDLVALGWTRSAVRNATRAGRITRVRHGVFCVGAPTELAPVLAAARAYPRATISHRSALGVQALPLLGRASALPELTVAPHSSVTMPGVHAYRATVPPGHRVTKLGAEVTSVARTLVDVGRDIGLDAAVVAMDAALHAGRVRTADVEQVLHDCRGWPGSRRAQRALELSDHRAESPLESVSRLAFPRLGLPAPEPQMDVFDLDGYFLGRTDFGWAELGVVGEADGRQKYLDPNDTTVLAREKDRQEAFELAGLVVARWGWVDARRQQPVLRARIQTAFARARARDEAGQPRGWELRPSRRAFPH